jgi:hypothetical protein
MATFLQICNRVRTEAGVAGGDLTTLQSGLSAESARFKSWVQREWSDIQAEHSSWSFLRRDFSFDTIAGQWAYTPQEAGATDDGTSSGADIHAEWKLDSLRVSTAGSSYADEAITSFMPYDEYLRMYRFGQTRAERAKPVVFSVRPNDQALALGNVPDGAYTVVGEYYRTPQTLSSDADVPLMPARFHDLIVFRALRAYAVFVAAQEVIGRAEDKISLLYPSLIAAQLPVMECGPPLA